MISKISRFGICIILGLSVVAFSAHGASVEELREQLESKKGALKDIEKKIQEFKQTIQIKKQEARTLEQQIAIIDDGITDLQLAAQKTATEVEETGLEIEEATYNIEQREKEIGDQKDLLANYLRAMNKMEQQSFLAVFLRYNSFSEVVSQAATYGELNDRTQETLAHIQQLREDLLKKRESLEDFKKTLMALHAKQEQQQKTLSQQQHAKEQVLELTHEQEKRFSSLLAEAQATHRQADAAIKELDTTIREELRKQGTVNLPKVGHMDWPIPPIFGVSCEFHCAGYPYAYLIGPHSAIDIPTYIGTPIHAPADGYVAKTYDSGGLGYSYILLLHGDNISTVYGHVSGFAVQAGQMVTRGTVIGYTGGAPGTHGAGLSSGPHLHFETRVNNVPVNPRNFL